MEHFPTDSTTTPPSTVPEIKAHAPHTRSAPPGIPIDVKQYTPYDTRPHHVKWFRWRGSSAIDVTTAPSSTTNNMFAAMSAQKRAKIDVPAPLLRRAATPPATITVYLGWPGSGKSRRGFERATQLHESVVFLSFTAALLTTVPKCAQIKLALTIHAFLARPTLPVPRGACLYIDEISMVPATLLARVVARFTHAAEIILTGDVYQIKPIESDADDLVDLAARDDGDAPGAAPVWFFEATQLGNANVTFVVEQHRLTGSECEEVRGVLEAVAQQHRTGGEWKTRLDTFVRARVRKTAPEGATIIVFTNNQIRDITVQWAEANGKVLTRHNVCVGMDVVVTGNKIKRGTPQHVVEYEHRNGQRGRIVAITQTATKIVDAESREVVVVRNRGVNEEIPQVKSAIAQTADAAQGKTYDSHVHVVFPTTSFPDPAKIIVALSRSKRTTFQINDRRKYEDGIRDAHFDARAVAFIRKASMPSAEFRTLLA